MLTESIDNQSNNINIELPQNDNKTTVNTYFSDDSSMFSTNMNISDTSSISNTDSTKIEDDIEEHNFIKQTPNRLSEKFEKCTLDSPKRVSTTNTYDKKNMNNFIKDISMSDFSDTLSENSSNLASSKSTDVSMLIKPSAVELNISGSSLRSNLNISLDKMQSDRSLFEESFSLQLSDNNLSKDSALGGSKDKNSDSESKNVVQNAFGESLQSDDDIFCNSFDEEYESTQFSAKKRKNGCLEENKSCKKFKNEEEDTGAPGECDVVPIYKININTF